MDFFETDVYLPVDRHTLEVITETPRVPTAFEWAAVKIVADFRAMPDYASASIGDVFRTALGGAGAEAFLETALNELFSATANVLATDVPDVAPILLPIASIRLTEDGERMLATGRLPSEPKRAVCKVAYDPIAHRLLKDEFEEATVPVGGATLDLSAEVSESPIEAVRTREEFRQKNGTRVGRISPKGLPRRVWRRQRVGFVLEGSRVSIDRKAFDLPGEVADYLEALAPERVRTLLFARAFGEDAKSSDMITSLPKEGVLQILTPSAAKALPAVPSRYVVRGSGCTLGRFAATAFEMEADVAEVPTGAMTDGKTMLTPLRIRCYYGDLPLELPVVVETALDDAARRRIEGCVCHAIANLAPAEQVRMCFQLAENHQQRTCVVADIVAKTSAEERISVLRSLLDDLHASTGYSDLHAVIDGVFGQPGLAGFADLAEAQALAEALPLTDEERRWTKVALRPYREGRAVVGEKPVNDVVWVEESGGGRPHHNGKNHNGKKRNGKQHKRR